MAWLVPAVVSTGGTCGWFIDGQLARRRSADLGAGVYVDQAVLTYLDRVLIEAARSGPGQEVTGSIED
jgi:hypothetical protein